MTSSPSQFVMENTHLPIEVSTYLGSESRDFMVKAGRAQPLKSSLQIIFFGSIWLAFTSIFFAVFLGPLFLGKEVHFLTNGVPTVASPDNLEPIILPAIIIGFFVLIGIAMLFSGIFSLFRGGGYFVGTPNRLVHYRNGTIKSIDWESFSGNVQVSGNAQKGDISLQTRSMRMDTMKNSQNQYLPDVIHISDIQNVFEIEQICRKRINESVSAPVVSEFCDYH